MHIHKVTYMQNFICIAIYRCIYVQTEEYTLKYMYTKIYVKL